MQKNVKLLWSAGACLALVGAGLLLWSNRPGDASPSCTAYYAAMKNPPAAAAAWCQAGQYFGWTSTLPENAGAGKLKVFYLCAGDPQTPAILFIHGYPTSSYDYSGVMRRLSGQFYVCALDTPGYGFSDKPKPGYHYSLVDDARLVDTFVRKVVGLKTFALVTHDKGDSVGLALLQIYQAYPVKPYTITQHLLINGNVYLPLAQLSILQKMLLQPSLGPSLSSLLNGPLLAQGLAGATYTPKLPQAEIDALASIFDYQQGTRVEYDIIQYLNERKANEVTWLETLGRSDIPTTLIWGEQDPIAPTAVPDYVWAHYLQGRVGPAGYWRIPCANHYVQVDQPDLLAGLIQVTLEPATGFGTIPGAGCQPVKLK